MPQRSPMFRHFRTENAEKTCKKKPLMPISPIWRYFGPSMGVVASDGLLGPITKHLRGRKKDRKKGRKKNAHSRVPKPVPPTFHPAFRRCKRGRVLHVFPFPPRGRPLHKAITKKGTCSPHKQTAGPKRKTSQILGKELCNAPEHLSC